MAYPHKWSPISYKSSAGQRKHIGQRPMLYRWTTQPFCGANRSSLTLKLLKIAYYRNYCIYYKFLTKFFAHCQRPQNAFLGSPKSKITEDLHKLECGPMPNVMATLPNIGITVGITYTRRHPVATSARSIVLMFWLSGRNHRHNCPCHISCQSPRLPFIAAAKVLYSVMTHAAGDGCRRLQRNSLLLVTDIRCQRVHQSDADRTDQQRQHQRSLHVRCTAAGFAARRYHGAILRQSLV